MSGGGGRPPVEAHAGVASEPLFLEVVSVSPRPMREIAARACWALDRAGDLAPDRGGFSERTRRLDGRGLTALVAGAAGRQVHNGLWVVFERRAEGLWGDLRIFPDTRLTSAPRFHEAGFQLPVDRLMADRALLDAAMDLLCDLFVVMDGFYGKADTGAMRRRRLALRGAAADGGTMWIPRWNDPRFVIWDRWVEDVWWVNLFGPAYVERWGRAVVERLGPVRRELANGGIAVWSTDRPPDPDASETIAGYPHKRRFYDVLGLDTFIHESLEIPEPGLRVPSLLDHARVSAA